ncbi:MAG: 4Fe-4S dicluster domain-containing protein, partial [Candidatus Bathyarchaeia archaeon]
TLVTNVVAQALKGGVPVLILPTDQSETTVTTLPIRVDSGLCVGCRPCPAERICEAGAFTLREGKGSIDYLGCVGCNLCLEVCPYGAVRRGEKVKVTARRVDLENVEKLRKAPGITVLKSPEDLRNALKRYLRDEP